MPKVSVLTPIYNTNIQFLREMIESVLNQTFKDFEFLILNDSPDNIELDRVVAEYQRRDPRIRYMKNETNLGISESRNKLFREACGEYLAILDHDDICAPERFSKQVEYLDSNQYVGVVGTWVRIVGKGRPLHFPVKNMDIKRAMMHECVISHSSAMIRKIILEKTNICWEPAYSPSEDYMLWARLIPHTLFHNIPSELLQWRVHENSAGHHLSDLMEDRAEMIRNSLLKTFPYMNRTSKWVYLFNILPIIKIKTRGASDTRILLFGVLPLFRLDEEKHSLRLTVF